MQMIHPLHAGAVRNLPDPVLPGIDQRVVQSTVRARQRRIVRTSLLLLATALLIGGMLIWRADSIRLRASLDALDSSVSLLQARIDELGSLPGNVDTTTLPGVQLYAGMEDRFYAMNSGRPTVVAASAEVSPLLRSGGRYVVIYDRGRLHIEWLSRAAYDETLRTQNDNIRAFEDRLRSRPPELP